MRCPTAVVVKFTISKIYPSVGHGDSVAAHPTHTIAFCNYFRKRRSLLR
jgi:hypothetical protein